MNKVRFAQLWQDTLLQINQKLLLQRDVASFLRVLKHSCLPVAKFQRINLLLLDYLHQDVRLYSLDELNQELTFTDTTHDINQNQLWTQQTVVHYNGETITQNFPELSAMQAYSSLSDCCHLPLETPRKRLGAIEFIKTDQSTFSDDIVFFLNALAEIVACAIENLLEIASLHREIEQVSQERDNFHVLVDVTNTAISSLEMSAMVDEVAKEIHHFFGISFVGLALYDEHDQNSSLRLYSALHQFDGPTLSEFKRVKNNGTLFQKTVQANQATVVYANAIQEISPDDPLLPLIASYGLQTICLLPLGFGQQMHGVMMLAHYHMDIFTPDNIKLLSQIASRVGIAVHNALDYEAMTELKENLVHENTYLAEQIQTADSFGEIIGTSEAIRKVLEQVEMVANSDCTVLILGETGTGKELFARAVHNRSLRKGKRMVKMNCAAVPSGLLESELFGHEKGAFTGASTQRIGRFELANGSSLMLDEVGDIPLELQPKLLRVLQEREIERLGSNKIIPVDVRLIAATNRNLKQMVSDSAYRADLYYRLNVFPIVIPPLRERKEDIPLLAHFFTQKLAHQMKRHIDHIPSEALRQLCEHPWPGNVRELANVIERAVILTSGSTLNLNVRELERQAAQMEDLMSPALQPTSGQASSPSKPKSFGTLPAPTKMQDDETPSERERILLALKESNGVVAGPRGAAAKLGVKRTTLLSRMQRIGISVKDVIQEDLDA